MDGCITVQVAVSDVAVKVVEFLLVHKHMYMERMLIKNTLNFKLFLINFAAFQRIWVLVVVTRDTRGLNITEQK
jgi:hypothetical protein